MAGRIQSPVEQKHLGWKKTLVFGLATTLLFLTLLEVGSRLLLGKIRYPPDPLIARTHARWSHSREYDSLLFWRLRPGARKAGDSINSIGLRGPEIPPKPAGEFRVLSLGESTTYGFKVPYDRTYNALLESMFQDGHDVRVINAGVPGYTLFQGRVFLEHRGLALGPDAVLLYFGFNDFLGVAFREQRDPLVKQSSQGLTDRQLFERRRRWPARTTDSLYRRSNLFRWLARTFAPATAGAGAVDLQIASREDLQRVPEKDRWSALEEILELCELHGIDLVLIIPWYRDFEGHAPLLRRFARQFDVPLVDLPSTLAAQSERRDEIFLDPSHPTVEGHELIADEVWKVVGDRWRMPEVTRRSPGS